MIKPDAIISWPRNCDYPLWRQFIRKERPRFNQVIIAFTETHGGNDYREFVKDAMQKDYILTFDAPLPNATEDWRNVAIRSALLHSYNAEWVWFTEQDFIINGEDFWRNLDECESTGASIIGVQQGNRLHPCCLFIKREVLKKTRQNFGIIPNISDHFSMLQEDIENLKIPVSYLTRGYDHLNGLSHNFRLISEGQLPVYKPEIFQQYLEACLQAVVVQNAAFVQIARDYLLRVQKLHN